MAWWHRVGQRVKKKADRPDPAPYSYPIGSEGVVVAIIPSNIGAYDCQCGCGLVYRANWKIAIRYEQISQLGGPCKWAFTDWDYLEPILPEGNKVVSWSDCLWCPPDYKENKRDSEHAREAVEVGG